MEGLRKSAWLVVVAAFAPLLLFVVFQIGFSAREQRRAIQAEALAQSDAVSLSADGEIGEIEAAIRALSSAQSLRERDFDRFRRRSADMMTLNPGWRSVELVDRSRSAALVAVGGKERLIAPTADTPAAHIAGPSGFVEGPGCPCLLFERPAAGPPGSDWRLRVAVSTARFDAMLPAGKGRYEVSALVTPNGRFVSRSLDGRNRFGTLGSRYLMAAARSGAVRGIYRGFTLEGFENYTAFTRSPVTDWTAHVALNSSYLDNPGRRFLASMGAAAILALALAVILILFALRQAAQARRVAEHMQQAQKLEALGQLTGGIAHDFNNLLTPIVGALDFLTRKDNLDARTRRLAVGALSAAERASKLTAQLLAFSRRQKLQIEPIDLASMLTDMSSLFEQSAGNSHRLEIDQEDGSLCAMGDLNQLELALLNLTLNARDASPPGSVVRLSIRGDGDPHDGLVMISVRDEGVGMDEATRLRAFEPFFTTKRSGGGTGLGLAQVFGMAEQSGGSVVIDSTPGVGTTVTMTLRRAPGAAPRRSPAAAAANRDGAPLRLLVIDDDAAVRAAIVHPLEEEGHVVDAVSDGPTALTAIAQRPFDLVLIDFAMPGMNGAEVIQRASAIRPGMKWLIVSGYADSDAITAAAPGTPVLKKPFGNDELIRLIRTLAG